MGKMLFASDLDNTLLFSRRHSRPGDVCVEMLDGKEQGYFSPLTIARLREVNACMDFVPVTSRSVAQYRRIQFPAGCVPRWAVTTNGGLLLENGEIDEAWRAESLAAVAPWRGELERTEALGRQLLEENACLSLRTLAVNGHDALKSGLAGPQIGQALHELLDQVAQGELPNERSALLSALERYLSP